MKIKRIHYQDTYKLRQNVMNPELSIEDMYREGDEDAFHFGLLDNNDLIAVISYYGQNQDLEPSNSIYRIRGMVVANKYQKKGLGKMIYEQSLAELKQEYQISRIWCNSRENAKGFYEKLGFGVTGSKYITKPSPGTRYRMVVDFQ